MSKVSARIYRETMAAIQADYGIVKSGGASADAIRRLARKAARDVPGAAKLARRSEQNARKLAELDRKLRALQASDARPPMPRHEPGKSEQLDAGQWITALQRVQPPMAVNGFDLNREVSRGEAPKWHPER